MFPIYNYFYIIYKSTTIQKVIQHIESISKGCPKKGLLKDIKFTTWGDRDIQVKIYILTFKK